MSDGLKFLGENRVIHRRRGDIPNCTPAYDVWYEDKNGVIKSRNPPPKWFNPYEGYRGPARKGIEY